MNETEHEKRCIIPTGTQSGRNKSPHNWLGTYMMDLLSSVSCVRALAPIPRTDVDSSEGDGDSTLFCFLLAGAMVRYCQSGKEMR